MDTRKNFEPVSVPRKYSNGFKIDQMEDVFNEIYKTSFWSHADGSGSDSRPEIVPEFLNIFKNILVDYNVENVGDLGCGSHFVFKDFDWPTDLEYTGYDASDIALQRARDNCNRADFKFVKNSDYRLIPTDHDMLLVKDVVCHWPKDLVIDFVENTIPKFRYCLIVGNPKINMFKEISSYKKEWLFKTSKNHDYGIWIY